MLLCYMALFLNSILVAALKLVPGWVGNNGPVLGGAYWLAPRRVGEEYHHRRVVGIVLYKIEESTKNEHLVALMKLAKDDGLPSTAFFDTRQIMADNGRTGLDRYRIFPDRTYIIPGDPNIMKLYLSTEYLSIMPKEDLGRLVLASGMVDGWPAGKHVLPYHVYWVLPDNLGIKEGERGHYIPCVVLPLFLSEQSQPSTNRYHVVMMSTTRYKKVKEHFAADFFGFDAKFGLPISAGKLNYLRNYWIYPGDYFEVKGDPKIMHSWNHHVIGLSTFDASNLEAVVHESLTEHHKNEVVSMARVR